MEHVFQVKSKSAEQKNAVLPIIAAALLPESGQSIIHDVPALDDVVTISEVLKALHARVTMENGMLQVDSTHVDCTETPYELIRKMRASFLVMGPLLTRKGNARVSLPGGCAIGTRPIDQHLKGFEAMGAHIEIGQGFIDANVNGRLQGAKIFKGGPPKTDSMYRYAYASAHTSRSTTIYQYSIVMMGVPMVSHVTCSW